MAFTESFTAATFTNLELLSGWTRGSGTAGDAYVNSNRLVNAHGGAADAYYLCPSQSSADHFTQAAVHGSGGGFICVRLTDANNFIGFRHDSSTGAWQVFKRVAGSFTQLGTDYVAALVAGDVGKLDANGDTLIFTVNGAQRCLGAGVTETFNNTEVRQGVVARGTTSSPWIDDFLAQGPVVAAELTGSITADDTAPTGTLASTPPSTLTGNITADDTASTGSIGTPPGTITLGPWKNHAGDALPSTTIPLLTFLRASDGVQVLTLTNQVTSSGASPSLAITNAALLVGVKYAVASWDALGVNLGLEMATAT